MKPFTRTSSFMIYVKAVQSAVRCAKKAVFASLVISVLSTAAFGQSFTWTDSFTSGVAPTVEQCNNWNTFLKGLAGQSFTAVTISGTFDPTGITITDSEAATQLAVLLSSATEGTTSGTVGSVVFEGRTWTVARCATSVCAGGAGVVLGIDGAECKCVNNGYAIRPHTKNWGGINTSTCGSSPSQTMTVKFSTGVSIVADGATTFCEGEKVTLTAVTDKCEGPYSYLWSTGETTESIDVFKSGTYSVELFGADNCSGISDPVSVTVKSNSVDAGDDAIFCDDPVQLNASASGDQVVENISKTCLFDSGGGDCSFTENLCDDGYEVVTSKMYAGVVSVPQEAGLRFKLYYSACTDLTTFTFRMNDKIIGSFEETVRTCSCTPILADGVYPQTVSFSFDDFKDHWTEGDNQISIEVASEGDVYMAGIVTEVSQTGFFTWSPIAGLSDATIANPLASPLSPTTYTVTYTAPNGCTAADDVFIDVFCGLNVTCNAVSVLATDNCTAEVSPEQLLESSDGEGELTYDVSPPGPYTVGDTQVTLTVTDASGRTGSCTTTVSVKDATLPTIAAPDPVTVSNDPAACSAMIVLDIPAASDNCGIKEVVNDHPDGVFPVGTTTVTWTAVDVNGNTESATQLVTVTNTAPVISSVTGPLSAVAVGADALIDVTYIDDNISHATIDWGDGSSATTVNSPALSFEVSHSYTSAGIYAVTVTLTDLCAIEATTVYESIFVYDGSGSVSGGGWFESPRGAYVRDPRATGKANFSFDASYDGYSTVPQGFARFKFKAGKVSFRSNQFQILIVDGQVAQLAGTGTVNGTAGYRILLSMVDDDTELPRDKKNKKRVKADRIRVKISDSAGLVLYDTQFGDANHAIATTHIGGGAIKIQKSESTFTDEIEDLFESGFGDESTSVYPNPFIDHVNIQFATESTADIAVNMMDLSGRVIARGVFPVSADGNYTLDVPESAKQGIYLLMIKQGERMQIVTVAKN